MEVIIYVAKEKSKMPLLTQTGPGSVSNSSSSPLL